MGRTHALSGAVAYAWLAPAGLDLPTMASGTALAAFAALLPDVDHPKSTLGRLLPLHRVLEHRGPTHYLLTWVAMSLGLVLLFGPTWWVLALSVGVLAHQFGDVITVAGIRWLAPLPFVVRGPIRAGGLVENALIFPLLALLGLWMVVS